MRRRKIREPSDERSRISRRKRGLRCGLTLEDKDICSSFSICEVLLSLVLNGREGGNAEECGAGGELDSAAEGMV